MLQLSNWPIYCEGKLFFQYFTFPGVQILGLVLEFSLCTMVALSKKVLDINVNDFFQK